MKKRILKTVALVIAICAILPALPAMAYVNGDSAQQVNVRKEKPVSPIEARKEKPVSPID